MPSQETKFVKGGWASGDEQRIRIKALRKKLKKKLRLLTK